MKKHFYILNDVLLLVMVLYAFVFGGIAQFFIGISPTIISIIFSYGVLALFFFKKNLKVDKKDLLFFLSAIILIIYIFIISLINNQDIKKPIIYSCFILVPVSVFLVINNKGKKDVFTLRQLKKVLMLVAIFQMPILFIQKYFYPLLITLNSSGQYVTPLDFQFGSFLVKNDHALGFFLIANILYVWSSSELKKWHSKVIITLILISNIFLTNSKVSMGLGVVSVFIIIISNRISLLKLIKRNKFLLLALSSFLLTGIMVIGGYEQIKELINQKLDYHSALKYFSLGQARREQILVVLYNEGIEFFGNGAYAYFDIVKGSFSRTFRHFSQLLWFYYDLGILGILLLIYFMSRIKELFNQNTILYNGLLFFGYVIFSYFTIVTLDITFILIYFIYKK